MVWHRCERDGLEHAVTDDEFAHGPQKHVGLFAAACGHTVRPGSMLLPPARPCSRCLARVDVLRPGRVSDSRPGKHRGLKAPAVPSNPEVSPGRNGRSRHLASPHRWGRAS